MKIERRYYADGMYMETVITVSQSDLKLSADEDLNFWKAVDKAAKALGVAPFCPCRERPHRIFCPLGFENYFPAKKAACEVEK